MPFWTPEDRLDTKRLRPGLRLLAIDHIFSQCMVTLTGGAFMVAFVLAMGGNNKTIGWIAAIGPIAQGVQIPAIFLVQSLRRRRFITVMGAWLSRSFFFFIAAIPWVLPKRLWIPALLAALAGHCLLGSIAGCSYGSWVRDVIPDRVMGRYMGRRLAAAIGIGAVVSLLAGVGIGYAKGFMGDMLPYSILFATGGLLGVIGTAQLTRVPEPRMPVTERLHPIHMLAQPLKHKPFRQVLRFLGLWAFAQNFAAPFFAVYMFERLGLSLGAVVALTVGSQVLNVAMFPAWGRLADRFSNKAVMGASGLLYVLSFLLWPLMTLPQGDYWATWPLLILAHLVMGVATAGVALSGGNLALKTAPRGQATAFLATNALVCGLGAAISPLLAGPLGDFFQNRALTIDMIWSDPNLAEPFNIPAFDLRGLDFLFLIAFAFGLYALHRLALVQERGEVSERVVLAELREHIRRGVFSIAGPSGVRQLMNLPVGGMMLARRAVTASLKQATNGVERILNNEPPLQTTDQDDDV